jgi:hypothetical protein
MEVVVKGNSGILPDSILSIRSGNTRRQSPLAAVDKPFKFPAKPEDNVALKFDVYRHVGTARTVSKAGTNDVTLTMDAIDRGGAPLPDFSNGGMNISFQLRPASQDTNTIGSGTVDQVQKDKTSLESDEYLAQHKIDKLLQSILQGLIKERPLDPYGFIVKQFVEEANSIAVERAANAGMTIVADPQEELRADVRGLLQTGIQTGLLDEILQNKPQDNAGQAPDLGTKERLGDATREVQDLQKTVEELQTNLRTLEQENLELLELVGEGDDPEARKAFVAELKSSGLKKAMNAGGESELDLQESKGGSSEKVDEEALRAKGRDALIAATSAREIGTIYAKERLILMDGDDLAVGAEALRRKDDAKGCVLQRTTTEALLKIGEESETWYPIEDIAEMRVMATGHPLEFGDAVVRTSDQAKCRVKECTATNVIVRMDDDTEEVLAPAEISQTLPLAIYLQEGDEALRLEDARKGKIVSRTGTDMQLRLDDGTEQWHPIGDLAKPKQRLRAPEAAVIPLVVVEEPKAKEADLSHVLALHRELELLAQDRASMMAQVSSIRDKLDQVREDNKKLASEVLSRPLSTAATPRSQELTKKYAGK